MEKQEADVQVKERGIFGSFFINQSEFALSVTHVQEVVNPPEKYTNMPLSPPYLKGLFNLRGEIIPVVDLRSILKLPETSNGDANKIAILEMGGYSLGLLFDRTGEIFKSQEDERSDFEDGANASVISGVFKKEQGKRIVQILNVQGIFNLQNIPQQGSQSKQSKRDGLSRKRGQRKQCISFVVGPSKCSLGIDEIQEILKIENVNESALGGNHCIGSIDLRGSTVPVIDFPALLGYRETDRSAEATRGHRRVIVMKIGEELFGLLVDSVASIVSYFPDELISFPVLNKDRAEMFIGCITHENQDDILLLNHQKILLNSEIAAITHGHSSLYRANLDKKILQKGHGGVRKTYITFAIEDVYAVGIEEVKEIIDYPKTLLQPPGLPKHVKGILNLRGDLVTIVDARAMYSASAKDQAGSSKVIIFKRGEIHFGLVVDSVEAIVSFSEDDRVKLPESLYKNGSSGLTADVAEAVEFTSGTEKKRSLLILSSDSIATRVGKSMAA